MNETVAEIKNKGIKFDQDPWLVKETGRTLVNFKAPDGWRLQLADMARGEAQEDRETADSLSNKAETAKTGVRAVDHIELIIKNAAQYTGFCENMGVVACGKHRGRAPANSSKRLDHHNSKYRIKLIIIFPNPCYDRLTI